MSSVLYYTYIYQTRMYSGPGLSLTNNNTCVLELILGVWVGHRGRLGEIAGQVEMPHRYSRHHISWELGTLFWRQLNTASGRSCESRGAGTESSKLWEHFTQNKLKKCVNCKICLINMTRHGSTTVKMMILDKEEGS